MSNPIVKISNQYIFFALIFLQVFQASGQKQWSQMTSPIYSDFKNIQFVNNDTAFIGQKKLIVYRNKQWALFSPPAPCEINLMYALNANSIFISGNNTYQSSDLYYWNGKNWQKINHPIANTISDIYFTDAKNGYLLSYGEIAELKNGVWKHLTPPTNRNLSKITINQSNKYVLSLGLGIYKRNTKWIFIKGSENVKNIQNINDTIYTISHNSLGFIEADSIHTINNNKLWQNINSITKNHNNHLIGVGNNGLTIDYYKKIDTIKMPVNTNINKIINQNNQLWAVGDDGTILQFSSQKNIETIVNWKGFEKLSFNNQAKLIDDEYGVVAADFNNDGLTDIFTNGLFEEEHLYINEGNLHFKDKAQQFGVAKLSDKNRLLNLGACAGDIDNDGYIDLYISVLNGKNIVFKNVNGKKFINYSNISKGIGSATDRSNAVIMGDVDNDGDLDIYVTNEYSSNRLYLNNGAGIFSENTSEAKLSTKEGGNAASFSDIDNDGDIDLLLTTWSSKNILYQNMLVESGKLWFKDISQSAKIGGNSFDKSNAVVFFDYNNDAYPDIFITNRKTTNRLFINQKNNTFLDKTETLIGYDKDESYGAVIGDFDGDGDNDIYVSNVGENAFYENISGKFIKQNQKYDSDIKGYSTGSAMADFDRDGDLDLYIANYLGESSTLLKNKKHTKNYVSIKIQGYGVNRNAVGSKIFAYTLPQKKLIFVDEITAGGNYVSMNSHKRIIPTQNADSLLIKVIFNKGITKEITVYKNNSYTINDLSGTARYIAVTKQFIKRHLLDPHRLFELLKWLFILFFVSFMMQKSKKRFAWKNIFTITLFALLITLYYVQQQQFEYDDFFFSTLLPLLSILLITLSIYNYNEKQLVKKEAEFEKLKIKKQLSQNLHDDLAATISSIGFYITLIKFSLKEKSSQVSEFIQKSESLLKDATDSITDMIWSFNAQDDSLENILFRLQNNFKILFQEMQIDFKIDWKTTKTNQKINHNTKQNIYLILKEILNNILKYSEASKVSITVNKDINNIIITVADNGKGFDLTKAKNKGNGLKNIQNRAIDFNGNINIDTAERKGTKVEITVPISEWQK